MASLAFIQLVLLTERPGARIGRVPRTELSDAERTVADVLEWMRKAERAYRSDDDHAVCILLREETPDWWPRMLDALERIGQRRLAGRTRLALRIMAVPSEPDPDIRSILVDEVYERPKRVASWLFVRSCGMLHEPLLRFVLANACDIPGAGTLQRLEHGA